MTPFELLQKNERRTDGPRAWATASMIQYFELRAYAKKYKLARGKAFYVNNIKVNVPFEDENGVRAFISGRWLTLQTPFGLKIEYDGNVDSHAYLCNHYTDHVCGLYGIPNGRGNDDFRNPQGQPIPFKKNYLGNAWTQYYRWGTTWRVGLDNDIDVDGQQYFFFLFIFSLKTKN